MPVDRRMLPSPPLITVVIPTRDRPHMLPKAVASALEWSCAQPERIEVIVVPSGDDTSWEQSLAPFADDVRLRVLPSVAGNANAARNAGLDQANGVYVRFLDDDDYLLPGASGQVERAEQDHLEVCSGVVFCVDEDDTDLGPLRDASSEDFVQAILGFSSLNLPVGNLFLRAAIGGTRWDPGIGRLQDLAWMCSLAATREWRWGRHEEPCGVWFQHQGPRVSAASLGRHRSRMAIASIRNLYTSLEADGRLNKARATAVARLLWKFVYSGFPFHPLHWHHVARYAVAISPETRVHRLRWAPGWFPAIGLEWLLLPGRMAISRFRRILGETRTTHRRKL
jgi:glycosyltransferase involved in cell wall biosynthesis